MEDKPHSESHVLKTFSSDLIEIDVCQVAQDDCTFLLIQFDDHDHGGRRSLTICSCCAAELCRLLHEAIQFTEQNVQA